MCVLSCLPVVGFVGFYVVLQVLNTTHAVQYDNNQQQQQTQPGTIDVLRVVSDLNSNTNTDRHTDRDTNTNPVLFMRVSLWQTNTTRNKSANTTNNKANTENNNVCDFYTHNPSVSVLSHALIHATHALNTLLSGLSELAFDLHGIQTQHAQKQRQTQKQNPNTEQTQTDVPVGRRLSNTHPELEYTPNNEQDRDNRDRSGETLPAWVTDAHDNENDFKQIKRKHKTFEIQFQHSWILLFGLALMGVFIVVVRSRRAHLSSMRASRS